MASMQAMDNLLNHLITKRQYVERLPNGYLSRKQELLDDFDAEEFGGASGIQQGGMGTNISMQTTSEQIPVNPGSGNASLQRALNREGA